METMGDIVRQEINEERFNRKHIDAKLRTALSENLEIQAKLVQGVELVQNYLNQVDTYYPQKKARIQQFIETQLDLNELVEDLFIGIAYALRPVLFTSITAQLASRLKFSDKADAIATVAELVAVLCQTDVFDITKEDKQASLMLVSRIPLDEKLIQFIEQSSFLPPMVCEPLELTHNFSSGYLTHNDSLVLGSGNHHDGDLCLDVLNLMGKVPLSLDTAFLCATEEVPTFEMKDQAQAEEWQSFVEQSKALYLLMVEQGNRLYFNHKVDKRGRIYTHGYHINTQGSAYKKAMLNFADTELVEGVPT